MIFADFHVRRASRGFWICIAAIVVATPFAGVWGYQKQLEQTRWARTKSDLLGSRAVIEDTLECLDPDWAGKVPAEGEVERCLAASMHWVSTTKRVWFMNPDPAAWVRRHGKNESWLIACCDPKTGEVVVMAKESLLVRAHVDLPPDAAEIVAGFERVRW